MNNDYPIISDQEVECYRDVNLKRVTRTVFIGKVTFEQRNIARE